LNYCIQVKSGSDTSVSFGQMKSYHKDQVLLEWYFWQEAGHCITEDGARINCVPTGYEVLYVGRESYGEKMVSVKVPYDKMRALKLFQKFEDMATYIELETLPEPMKSKTFECNNCGLYQECWY